MASSGPSEAAGRGVRRDGARVLATLEMRLNAILPAQYQESDDDVQPVSMGSAGLKYGADGRVAWNEIWQTFCDLAMAGGPPHRGTLLEPGLAGEIDERPDADAAVVDEVCRGITLVADLAARRSADAGWVDVTCHDESMAGWLMRAIVMENVAARAHGVMLKLPAGPGYRVEKEIKNVITTVAKTCHYWTGHLWRAEQHFIADLFASMEQDAPLIVPASREESVAVDTRADLKVRPYEDDDVTTVRPAFTEVLAGYGGPPELQRRRKVRPYEDRDLREDRDSEEGGASFELLGRAIERETGLRVPARRYASWIGVECPGVGAAVWMMRMLAASNLIVRREGTTLFLPLNPTRDPNGLHVRQRLLRVRGFATDRGVL